MAGSVGLVSIFLKSEDAQFREGMIRAAHQFNSTMNGMRAEANRFAGFMKTAFAGAFAGFGIGYLSMQAKQWATDLISVNRQYELMKGSLKTVTGSTEAAASAMKMLTEFAAATPFTLDQSIEAFIKLKALGLDPSAESLRSYGNTASAMGKQMTQMIEAVADAVTFEFERLKEFGIKARQSGDTVSFTFQGVTTTVKKNADEIQKYLKSIGTEKFGDAMKDQMEGLPGKLSNLEDNFNKLKYAVGEGGFTTAISDAADMTAKFFSEIIDSGKAEKLGEVLGKSLGFIAQSAVWAIDKITSLYMTIDSFSQWAAEWTMSLAYGVSQEDVEKLRFREENAGRITTGRQQRIEAPAVVADTTIGGTSSFDPEMEKAIQNAIRDIQQWRKIGDQLTMQFDPIAKYESTLTEINTAFDRGLISAEVHTRALVEANKQLRESYRQMLMATREWSAGAQVALSDYAEAATDAAANTHTVFMNAFRGVEDALTEFVTKFSVDLTSLIQSIQADIARMLIRQNITGPLAQGMGVGMGGQSFLYDYGSGGGGGLFGGIGSFLGSLFGGFRAAGGDVDFGRSYVVGERGPELFVPKSSGTIIPSSGGGMTPQINQTIMITQPVSERTARRSARQIANQAYLAAWQGARA